MKPVIDPRSRRARALALLLALGLLAFAFVGRAVLSADDGADMMADTLGFLVQGRFESATLPATSVDPFLPPTPAFRSRYGVLPSLVLLPFVGAAWPLRAAVGPEVVEACASLAWAVGTLLAALAFFRLARALRPGASPFWMPAFLGGTYLWAYAADSYIEPWSAAALALAGAFLLETERSPARQALCAAAAASTAFWLRPVAWVTAPVLVLAALLLWRERADGARRAAWLLGGLASGLALALAANALRTGAPTDFGHGFAGRIPFVYGPLDALVRTTLLPGRGVLFYAPVVGASVLAARRLSWGARALCYGAPLVLVAVTARWFVWHGGACWGPRFLLPALPLLVAPAVLAPRRLAVALLALGAAVNVPGVLVSAGAYQHYAETLQPPPGAAWPRPGGDRVSELASMTPLLGHPWLLARSMSGRDLPAPWLAAGAREVAPAPSVSGYLSPWIARRAVGLPPVSPFLPRMLVRAAVAYLQRGRPAQSERFAQAALSLDPRARDAARVLEAARGTPRP